MSKKPTKAIENIYCAARCSAAEDDESFASRENAAQRIGIDRTRLARIELGTIDPYPDEVLVLADAYNSPELCNAYCAEQCPIGRRTVKKVRMDDFDRLSLQVLASLKDVNRVRDTLIAISEDGKVNNYERAEFDSIMDSLEKISNTAEALKIWAVKNLDTED